MVDIPSNSTKLLQSPSLGKKKDTSIINLKVFNDFTKRHPVENH